MRDFGGVFLAIFFIFCLSCGVFRIGYEIGKKQGERQGQIDAINGRVYYQLVANKDGEMLYEMTGKMEGDK